MCRPSRSTSAGQSLRRPEASRATAEAAAREPTLVAAVEAAPEPELLADVLEASSTDFLPVFRAGPMTARKAVQALQGLPSGPRTVPASHRISRTRQHTANRRCRGCSPGGSLAGGCRSDGSAMVNDPTSCSDYTRCDDAILGANVILEYT